MLGSGWSYSINWSNGFIFHEWGYSFIGSPEPVELLYIEVVKIVLTFLTGFFISYFYRPLEKDLDLSSSV